MAAAGGSTWDLNRFVDHGLGCKMTFLRLRKKIDRLDHFKDTVVEVTPKQIIIINRQKLLDTLMITASDLFGA